MLLTDKQMKKLGFIYDDQYREWYSCENYQDVRVSGTENGADILKVVAALRGISFDDGRSFALKEIQKVLGIQ